MDSFEKRKSFYSQFLHKDDLYFDIGANLGNRVGPILELGVKVVAVEPQYECCEYLEKKFGKDIHIVKKGLSDIVGMKKFYRANFHTISTFSLDWIEAVKKSGRFCDYKWDVGTMLEVTTLDELIKDFGIPTFIKIDVEGHEVHVLKGLSQKIKCISFEYTVPEKTVNAVECLNRIKTINNHVECNFSIGESMELASEKWLSYEEMMFVINSVAFKKTGFGDIYVRLVIIS